MMKKCMRGLMLTFAVLLLGGAAWVMTPEPANAMHVKVARTKQAKAKKTKQAKKSKKVKKTKQAKKTKTTKKAKAVKKSTKTKRRNQAMIFSVPTSKKTVKYTSQQFKTIKNRKLKALIKQQVAAFKQFGITIKSVTTQKDGLVIVGTRVIDAHQSVRSTFHYLNRTDKAKLTTAVYQDKKLVQRLKATIKFTETKSGAAKMAVKVAGIKQPIVMTIPSAYLK